MRLLLVADLHYTLPQFDWLVRVAPAFDVVVIAGDLLDISSTVPLNAQAVVVLRYLRLLHETTTLVVGSGNHDLTGPDARGEQAALWLAEARTGGEFVTFPDEEPAEGLAGAEQGPRERAAFEVAPGQQHVPRRHRRDTATRGILEAAPHRAVRRHGAVAVVQDPVADEIRERVLEALFL